MRLQERFDPIYTYHSKQYTIVFYDACHFEERMNERAIQSLGLTKNEVLEFLAQGAASLDKEWSFDPGNYMIRKHGAPEDNIDVFIESYAHPSVVETTKFTQYLKQGRVASIYKNIYI